MNGCNRSSKRPCSGATHIQTCCEGKGFCVKDRKEYDSSGIKDLLAKVIILHSSCDNLPLP
jgi:hypothetical protein